MLQWGRSYSREQLQNAVSAVISSDMTRHAAASAFGIPESTLRGHVKRYREKHLQEHSAGPSLQGCVSDLAQSQLTCPRRGVVKAVPSQVEQEVVVAALSAVQIGFTLNSDWLYAFIVDMAKEGLQGLDQPDLRLTPTRNWARQLVSNCPSLRSLLPSLRRRSVGLVQWYNVYERLLVSLGFLGASDVHTRVWSVEEVGFSHGADVDWPVVRHSVAEYASSREGYFSVLCCGSACGHLLPPLVVFSGKVLEGATIRRGPPGALYGVSDSGWVDSGHFFEWFQDFVDVLYNRNVSRPVVLLVSDRVDYLSLHLLRLAEDNRVHILAMPPSLSSPFMSGVFKQAGDMWGRSVRSHCTSTNVPAAANVVCAGLLSELWQTLVTPYCLVTAFRNSGLLPFRPAMPPTDKEEGEGIKGQTSVPTHEEVGSVQLGACVLQDCLVEQEHPALVEQDLCIEGVETSVVSPLPAPVETDLSLPLESGTNTSLSHLPGPNTLPSPDSLVANASSHNSLQTLLEDAGIIETTVLASSCVTATASSPGPPPTQVTQCAVCWGVCAECSDEAGSWVGCDHCHKWFHYYCVGLPEMIDSSTAFLCPNCLR